MKVDWKKIQEENPSERRNLKGSKKGQNERNGVTQGCLGVKNEGDNEIKRKEVFCNLQFK